uniref:Uncharacterized protein n=1 Tax=Hyaloperonospora arabidopsidis (strain Emoy2) TaxID=559515 RepID=M4C5I8_HYAAE
MVTTLTNQRDYVFTPPSVEERLRQTTGQSLATWTTGPVASSLEEKESGQALRESMYALRVSVSVADVRLERKLRYDYTKLKARGQLRNRTRYASATTVAAGAGQTVTNNPPIDTTSGGKRPRLKMTLATMFKNIHGVWAVLPKGNLTHYVCSGTVMIISCYIHKARTQLFYRSYLAQHHRCQMANGQNVIHTRIRKLESPLQHRRTSRPAH